MIVLDGDDNFDSGQPFVSSRYVSPAQTITASAEISLPHGLVDRDGVATAPFGMSFYLECITPEHGYSVGNKIVVSLNSTDSAVTSVNSMDFDSTNVYFRISGYGTAFLARAKGTNSNVRLTNANWQLYIAAWA